jgi:putative membrane protein
MIAPPLNFMTALLILIICLHGWFLILEMFLWTRPTGLRVFRQSLEDAKKSAVLAANQGLYNGFLSAGLFWSLVEPRVDLSHSLQVFFLSCVVIAGAYGGVSVSRRIFFVQALPAAVALVFLAFHP